LQNIFIFIVVNRSGSLGKSAVIQLVGNEHRKIAHGSLDTQVFQESRILVKPAQTCGMIGEIQSSVLTQSSRSAFEGMPKAEV